MDLKRQKMTKKKPREKKPKSVKVKKGEKSQDEDEEDGEDEESYSEEESENSLAGQEEDIQGMDEEVSDLDHPEPPKSRRSARPSLKGKTLGKKMLAGLVKKNPLMITLKIPGCKKTNEYLTSQKRRTHTAMT